MLRSSMLALLVAALLLLSGCASPLRHTPNPERFPEPFPSGQLDFQAPQRTPVQPLPLQQRLAGTDIGAPRLYSFRANNQSLRVTLAQFAAAYNLNIIADADIVGALSVEFRDLPLERALDALLDPIGVGWVREDGLIRVTRTVSRTWQVDYLGAARRGELGGGGALDFWSGLETELRSLLTRANTEAGAGERLTETVQTTDRAANVVTQTTRPVPEIEGRIVVNRLTGTVVVSGSPRAMRAVESYMERLLARINRQVFIEARVLDVTLRDSNALGIDWTRVQLFGGALVAATSGIVQDPMGGAGVAPPTLRLDYVRNFPGAYLVRNIAVAFQALEEQGAVRVVSQPRIRTLNNQPAVVRVGTERTFFTRRTVVTPGVGGAPPTRDITDEPHTITEGVTLTVTPQIGNDGMITLDVQPELNRVVGVDASPSGDSNAPRMETKQVTTLVRMRSGETVAIGGLIIEEDAETHRGVPGAIAARSTSGLGWLFGGQNQSSFRKELVIFLTAHLVEH